jgi:hypothetical protein
MPDLPKRTLGVCLQGAFMAGVAKADPIGALGMLTKCFHSEVASPINYNLSMRLPAA